MQIVIWMSSIIQYVNYDYCPIMCSHGIKAQSLRCIQTAGGTLLKGKNYCTHSVPPECRSTSWILLYQSSATSTKISCRWSHQWHNACILTSYICVHRATNWYYPHPHFQIHFFNLQLFLSFSYISVPNSNQDSLSS